MKHGLKGEVMINVDQKNNVFKALADPSRRLLLDLLYEAAQIWIRTSPERLWRALTDPEMTRKFLYQSRVVSDWKLGNDVTFVDDEGCITAVGKLVALDPPKRLSYTWKLLSVPETAVDEPSRITYEIIESADMPDVCSLTVTHDQFEHAPHTFHFVGNGWPAVLSNLKTLLETGTPLIEYAIEN
ncbi:SRPBCC family protein [Paenibacillus eucommiae]|uniref:Uncharacterized protein YndB with AHSA1/START domain n=1 Tax=Paenibacillus eucommiae TaxID=1355755 RepID=A0ABS4J9Y5_9BACL|nr:SRPBCC family protein [Paenibacillus eucommiae]MBP1996669.1 uncharacterized protein YndB with AHSA1/START domain [Paenibacillus eucommiae]